ncbi:MAG: ThuA domain-containing protein [Luteolibacter sp.]
MKTLAVILCAASLQAAVASAENTEKKVRLLLVDGFSNHNWQLNTALIRDIVEPTGLFTLDVSTSPPTKDSPGWDTWRPRFSDYDVVIQTCNDINGGPSWPDEVETDFENHVRNGGGVFIYHSANNAFPGWDAYNHIIGLGWRKPDQGIALAVGQDGAIIRIPAGEGKATGHGERVDAVITRIGDHPIHEGLPRKWKTPDIEIYHYARGPAENVEVLSYAYDVKTDMRWPIEWTVSYGKGRVYTATYGHVWKDDTQPERMRCAGVQTVMIRALWWLARRDEKLPVPADFPTETAVSIRKETPPAP